MNCENCNRKTDGDSDFLCHLCKSPCKSCYHIKNEHYLIEGFCEVNGCECGGFEK